MEEVYKDWKINYYEGTFDKEKFVAKNEDNVITGKTLQEIKTAIDNCIKKAFKRIPCFYRDYRKIVEAEITSVFKTDSTGRIRGIYISIKNDTTRKIDGCSLKDIYKYTKENKQLFKEIQELKGTVSKLEGEISSKQQNIEKINFEAEEMKIWKK